jgi:hypothetical protein
MLVYGYFDFQIPPYIASRHLLIPRIAATGTSFSPLPCQLWHRYRVSSAHRVELEVGADGPASAPPSRSTAAAPPPGFMRLKKSGFKYMVCDPSWAIGLQKESAQVKRSTPCWAGGICPLMYATRCSRPVHCRSLLTGVKFGGRYD